MFRSVQRAIVGLVAFVMLAAACGGTADTVKTGSGREGAPPSDPALPTRVADIDSSYQSPSSSQMIANPTDDGILYWARSENSLALSRIRGGSVESWTAPSDRGPVQSAIAATIAADRKGVVWVAADGTLARFDTNSGVVTSTPLPTPRDNAFVESSRPEGIRGTHHVAAIATDNSGHVAIAFRAASELLVFDDAAGDFDAIELPDKFESWSVAYFSDGSLAIGGADETQHVAKVLVVGRDGTIGQTVEVPDASRLLTLSSGTEIVAGLLGPSVMAQDGRVTPLALPKGVVPSQTLGGFAVRSDGDLVVATVSELLHVRRDGTVASKYTFPMGECGLGSALAGEESRDASTPTECPQRPYAVQVDRTGDVYMARRPLDPARATGESLVEVLGALR